MTVREAFRRERRRLWEDDISLAVDLHNIAVLCGSSVEPAWVMFKGQKLCLVPDYETFQRRELQFEHMRQLLREATERLIWRVTPTVPLPPTPVATERWWRNYTNGALNHDPNRRD
jgi:hypothetical protein